MQVICITETRIVWTIGNDVRPGPDPGEICEVKGEDEIGYVLAGYGKRGFPKGLFKEYKPEEDV